MVIRGKRLPSAPSSQSPSNDRRTTGFHFYGQSSFDAWRNQPTISAIEHRHTLTRHALEEVARDARKGLFVVEAIGHQRSEEHTSELQSLMRISYAVFCLKNKKKKKQPQ